MSVFRVFGLHRQKVCMIRRIADHLLWLLHVGAASHLKQVGKVVRDDTAHNGDVDEAAADGDAAPTGVFNLELDGHLWVLPLEALYTPPVTSVSRLRHGPC